MNSQMNCQPETIHAVELRAAQGTWPLPSAFVTASAAMEWEQENARLRLALREAHHRSGNQWQLLLGLAELEAIQNPQTAGAGDNKRLRAMMSAFATLNQALAADADVLTSHQKVSVRGGLESILAQWQTATGKDALSFAVQDAWLSEKGYSALLLGCAELVCNAAKYGRKTTQVIFRVRGQQGILEVHDDGPGFPAGFRVGEMGGQGLQLVEALCQFDLHGEMRCQNSVKGAIVTLAFPVLSAPEAIPLEEAATDFCAMDGVICFDALLDLTSFSADFAGTPVESETQAVHDGLGQAAC